MSGAAPSEVWTVSAINRCVKDLIEKSLGPFWLGAEVGDLTIHRSGHVYLSLKDNASQLRGVFFSGAGAARAMQLQEGMQVEAFGRLTVYEPRGSYQFSITTLRPKGIGALQQQFEELKARLLAEGLFDESRKQSLPLLPRCVGVITSLDGAALRDFLNVLDRRFGDMHVRICPTSVQGAGTAEAVAGALRSLNEHRACDVIVITRGGGSLEDLWAFNDETLARAVAASSIPVVSAIGHEVDFTICDFVADLRVPTPSAAGELVVARKGELTERITLLRQRLAGALMLRVTNSRVRLQRSAMHPVFREPVHLVRTYQQRVDEQAGRLQRALQMRLQASQQRLQRASGQLRLLDPKQVLERGYTMTVDQNGRALTSIRGVQPGDVLTAVLADGRAHAVVSTVESDGPSE
jgi:exodeoxyribonuclease VII large subunit